MSITPRWLLGAAGAVAMLGACSRDAPSPSVLLITIDTTRADHLGQYGAPDARTPAFDRWARGGVLIMDDIVDVPITLPSHVTLFTGVPAPGHGVWSNTDFRLAPEARTLAERLSDEGYLTAAIVSSRALAHDSGIDQGFASFDDEIDTRYVMQDPARYPADLRWLPPGDRRADEAVGLALEQLRRAGGRPSLLWLHLIDPHAPYDPPPPFGEIASDLYQGEIDFTDLELRRLQRALEERDAGHPRLTILTSDHGEALGEHLEDEHGLFLYDATVRVPLAIAGPGVPAGRVVAGPVRSIDVAPTILDLLHRAPDLGAGSSLVPLIRGEGPSPDSVAYSGTLRPQLAYGAAPLWSLRTRTTKFVWAPRPELYDLASDPGETVDLLEGRPTDVEPHLDELRRRLAAARASSPPLALAPDRDEESLAALRALGYLSSPGETATTDLAKPAGPDPKDLVDVVLSGRDLEMGYYDRAEEKIRRFLRTAAPPESRPDLRPLWANIHQNEAALRMARGEFAAATESYRECLTYDPRQESARWGLVFALNLAGRPQEAVREADAFLADSGSAWTLRVHRAMALALLGRRDDARSAFAEIERGCPDPAVVGFARDSAGRIGTEGEARFMDLYLHSEGGEARAGR